MLLFYLLFVFYFLPVQSSIHVDSIRLRSGCCLCRSYALPCAHCSYGTDDACVLVDDALETWAKLVVNAYFNSGLPNSPYQSNQVYKTTKNHAFLSTTAAGFTLPGWEFPCQSIKRTANSFYGSVAYPCNKFANQCVTNTTCKDVTAYGITNPNSLYSYYCQYNVFSTEIVYFLDQGSSETMCNPQTLTSMICPETVKYITKSMQDQYPTNVYDINDELVYESYDTSALTSLLPYLETSSPVNPLRSITMNTYGWCSDDPKVRTLISGQKWAYFLNVAIHLRSECTQYIPFNTTHDVCVHDLFAIASTPYCQDSFRTRMSTSILPITIKQPVPLRDINSCLNCADYIVEQLQPKDDINLDEFARIQNNYAQARQAESRSWWDNIIGGIFTMPLFSKLRDVIFEGIDYLLIEFLKIVGDILLNFLHTVYSLIKHSQPFIEMLTEYITEILDIAFSILSLLLKAAIGILIQAEQHFLIFEYVTLFLWLNYKFLNNNIFCILIVIIFAIIFGIERNHPSLLLTFYNAQYSYVNFTFYNSASFSNKYQITYHNRTNQSSKNLSISLPHISTIPKYNTSLKEPSYNYPLYNTTTTGRDCKSFPSYNTSEKF